MSDKNIDCLKVLKSTIEAMIEKLEQENPLVFEVGKYYKTRGGNKAFGVGMKKFSRDQPFVFEVENNGLISTDMMGRYLDRGDKSQFDIVGEWHD